MGLKAKIKHTHQRIKNHSKYELFLQIFRFGIIGLGTVIIDWITFLILNKGLGINYLLADILNVPILLSFNYIGHKYFTFQKRERSVIEVGKYFLVVAFNQLESWSILLFCVAIINLDTPVSKIIQLAIMPVVNFFLLKFIVFKKNYKNRL